MISNFRCTALILLIVIFALGGCASRTQVSRPDIAIAPQSLYAAFQNTYGNCNATGLRAKASLYYTSRGSGHRTTMTLWGEYASPLRLDVRAGIGAYIAHIREDDNGLTAFYPDQKTAYTHSSPVRAVHLLGLPFPFSLKDLAGLISGCYPNLIPKSYDTAVPVAENGNLRFSFDNGPVSTIVLTEQGTPVEISGRGEIPWRMELSSYEEDGSGKLLPEKIAVYTELGDKALLRIKSRNFTSKPWQQKALQLKLPEGSEEIRLDRNGYVKID
ncbi:hypothetical protein [Desulfovibrio sp. JC022]|uniref:hypothetical protein n=1 Tax=Desulfovibrio sp. JC022 TaxID=2593642 RepID=UPI0013D78FFC|nr:hypothetical protein [Desulfovibrio sp. JC022]NDV22131.1 hypothetical protein [Desulfovibrio sp. JC022]